MFPIKLPRRYSCIVADLAWDWYMPCMRSVTKSRLGTYSLIFIKLSRVVSFPFNTRYKILIPFIDNIPPPPPPHYSSKIWFTYNRVMSKNIKSFLSIQKSNNERRIFIIRFGYKFSNNDCHVAVWSTFSESLLKRVLSYIQGMTRML